MPALVIEAFPEALHTRLKETAAAHHRSVAQEAIHLLENGLTAETKAQVEPKPVTVWTKRDLLPEYEALLRSGALSGGTDSAVIISEERDAR